MNWSFDETRPIYSQLIEQFTFAILSGELSPGEKLPGVRDLALAAAVNPNTMQRALAELERSGLLYTRRTAGRFATEDAVLIEQIKVETAQKKLYAFLDEMKQIGFSSEDPIHLLKKE